MPEATTGIRSWLARQAISNATRRAFGDWWYVASRYLGVGPDDRNMTRIPYLHYVMVVTK